MLRFDVRYDTSRLAPGRNEMFPLLFAWTSFNGTKTMKIIPFKMEEGSFYTEKATVEFELPPPGQERADDAVWMEAYAHDRSHSGTLVRTRVGANFVYVSHLLENDEVSMNLSVFNYVGRDGRPLVKGHVDLSDVSVDGSYTPQPPEEADPFSYLPSNACFLRTEMETAIVQSVWPFTDHAAQVGESLEPLDTKNAPVHAPTWASPTGKKIGSAYFVTPGRSRAGSKVSSKYMERSFLSILKRHNMGPETFISIVNAQMARTGDEYDDNYTMCCSMFAEFCCAASVSVPYIGDSVETASRLDVSKNGISHKKLMESHHGVESFDWAQLRSGGDCEDSARLIHSFKVSIEDGEWKKPLLLALQSIARSYISVGVLTSVLGSKLSDGVDRDEPFIVGTGRDDDVQIGAHMYVQLFPEHKFLAMLERCHPNLDIDSIKSPFSPTSEWREKMPHLVLEGTGRLSPLQRPAISYATDPLSKNLIMAKVIARERCLAYIAKRATAPFNGGMRSILAIVQIELVQKSRRRVPNARVGTFYRDPVSCWTDDFLVRGFPVSDFTFMSMGDVDLVPANADIMFDDDPMLSGTGFDELAEQLETSMSLEEGVLEPMWRTPMAEPAQLMSPFSERRVVGKRMDKRPDDFAIPSKIRYGLPLTTILEDRPMRDHAALIARPPIDSVTAAILATHFRHSKPVPVAGDMRMSSMAQNATEQAMRNAGMDVDGRKEHMMSEMATFHKSFGAVFDGTLEDRSDLTIINMFFPVDYFHTPGIGRFIMGSLKTGVDERVFTSGRLLHEEFIPGRKFMVIQLQCDATAISSQK